MRNALFAALICVALAGGAGFGPSAEATSTDTELSKSLRPGKASPESMSALLFAPDGTLFLGDSKGGAVFAIATRGEPKAGEPKPVQVQDIESKIAARLGTSASEIMVHDMAVHPLTHQVYLAVSRGRAKWESEWQLPNHVADAEILLQVNSDGTIHEVSLESVRFARVALPNPISASKKHPWMKEMSLRTDTITDMAYTGETLLVAGLSNEEFASSLWKIPVPFRDGTSATTLEIFHGAHGEYETHAPIRTFVPYELDGEQYILAAYLCTPLSLFKVEDLENGTHVRGRTIAEFGSGNYPLDMVVVEGAKNDRVLIANSNLPLISLDTRDIAEFDGEIIERPESYSAGVEHIKRSGVGIQQMDRLDDHFLVMLKRMPNGRLDLESLAINRAG